MTLLLVVMGFITNAQSPQFSQFYANQMYLNPAFTGNTPTHRISSNYRLQWPGVGSAFNSLVLGYDYNWAARNIGLGFMAVRDQAGVGGLSYTSFNALASYQYRISDNLVGRGGISYGVGVRAADVNQYLFSDEIITGGATTANIDQRRSYGVFHAGFLVYNEHFWGGFAMNNLNRPNESLVISQESRTPTEWSFHGGYKFTLEESKTGEVVKSIIATTQYKLSSKFDQWDIGGYYVSRNNAIGVWYRGLPGVKRYQPGYPNNDALVLMYALQIKAMRVGFSYDLTISQLQVKESYGAYEFSLVYEWANRKRKKKKRRKAFIVPCPRF